jgi:cysteine desulfurase / selenocysteine lyase
MDHGCPASCPPPTGPFDIERIRAQFPVLAETVHGRPLVYLDSAATSQKPVAVIRAVCDYYGTCNANVHRAYHFLGEESTRRYEAARATVARFFGAASPREIVFTRGTTEAINLVAHGWARRNLRPGDRLLVSEMEHHSNLVPWQMAAAATGATMERIPVLDDGTLDLDTAARVLRAGGVRLVAVTHQSNVLGTINPIAELSRLAHEAGALLLADGAQSAVHGPWRMAELGCDFLACSGHKMCGPTGIGVLYARAELLEAMDPFMGGGEMIDRVDWETSTWAEIPHKFEAGTPPVADAIGLGAAVDWLTALDRAGAEAWTRALLQRAFDRLGAIPGVRIFGAAPERGAVVSFTAPGVHPHDLAQFLDQDGIAIRAGHLCCQPLLRRLGVPAVSRASLLFYNRPDEVDRLEAGIRRAMEYFGHGA